MDRARRTGCRQGGEPTCGGASLHPQHLAKAVGRRAKIRLKECAESENGKYRRATPEVFWSVRNQGNLRPYEALATKQ